MLSSDMLLFPWLAHELVIKLHQPLVTIIHHGIKHLMLMEGPPTSVSGPNTATLDDNSISADFDFLMLRNMRMWVDGLA